MTINIISYSLDIFKYFLVMFYHKKIQKRMKLYKGELIIFFVSGKDAKVYNGSSPLQGGWVRGGSPKSFLSHEIGPGGHNSPYEMDGTLGQGGTEARLDCQIDGIKNKFLLDI